VNRIRISLLVIGIITVTLCGGGCAKRDEAAATPPAAATPTPQPATGDLAVAKGNLDRAKSEINSRNYRGAVDFVDLARAEVMVAAGNAEDKARADLEGVGQGLDALKGLLQSRSKDADAELTKVYEKLAKLIK
jgi:hypothetical protein